MAGTGDHGHGSTLLERRLLLAHHGPDAPLSRLDGKKVADDVDGRLLAGGSALLRQFDDRRRRPLHLAHVLAALADDAAHLARRHQELDRQTDVLAGRHEPFLAHLLENEVLGLPLGFRRPDDRHFPLGLRFGRCPFGQRSDFHRSTGKTNNVPNVGAARPDDSTHCTIGDVQETRLLFNFLKVNFIFCFLFFQQKSMEQ